MRCLLFRCALVLFVGTRALARDTEPYELPPINYSATKPQDAITSLQTRLAKGEFKLAGRDRPMLRSLLQELQIPVESQVVVFSRTSLQRQRIRPDHPRAIYFSDTCYVGWVPGGLVEIVSIDPIMGPIFYALDPATARTNAAQSFVRENDCMRCHGGTFIRDIPGVFVRSVFTDDSGEPMLKHGSEIVDSRTAFTNRWGGWYVTGKHGDTPHRGNIFAQEKGNELVVDFKRGANLTDLSHFFDVESYLTNSSDIVALLVLEHQTMMQNTLTRASLNCRKMLEYQKNLQRDLKEKITEELVYDSVKSVFDGAAREIVDDLLFQGEAALPEGLEGSAAFQKTFAQNARRTSSGASLKDFSLKGHLFANRCSYMIYTESFLKLPIQLKQRVYERLTRALNPSDADPRFVYLGQEERRQITKILCATHQEFAAATTR